MKNELTDDFKKRFLAQEFEEELNRLTNLLHRLGEEVEEGVGSLERRETELEKLRVLEATFRRLGQVARDCELETGKAVARAESAQREEA